MNVNKKFNRLRQWGKEKMGAEIKSGTSEDFKSLENEMNLRNDGLERMHASMTAYVKSLNKRVEIDGREKATAIASLGTSMAKHGEDFDDDSRFGQCLVKFGLANERLARTQDSFATQASGTWLDALERSLVQMKDYQNARKKLESRRLAYDTSLIKIEKAKKEDYRAEEGMRSQKAKFEESTEDVQRRMQDILESETANIHELQAFLEAELNYHERCHEILLLLKKDWPLPFNSNGNIEPRRRPRSRDNENNNLGRSKQNVSTFSIAVDDETADLPLPNPSFRNSSRTSSANSSPHREPFPSVPRRMEPDTNQSRVQTPLAVSNISFARKIRSNSGQNSITPSSGEDIFASEDDADANSSPDQQSFWDTSYSTRSSSPATSVSCGPSSRSRNGSRSTIDVHNNQSGLIGKEKQELANVLTNVSNTVKKKPPPPPPSRIAKPPAPPLPPPLKRSALSTGAIPGRV